MKEIIKNVLSQYKNSQVNLGSDSAVESISAEIETAILKHLDPFSQNDFSPDEGDHRWPGLDAIIKENGGLPHHSNLIAEGIYPWHENEVKVTRDGDGKLLKSEEEIDLDNRVREENINSEWVCGICGEDTSRVEYDYIGTGYNHLKCELEHEEEQ